MNEKNDDFKAMNCIPVAGPWITQKEIDYVIDAVTNAWYGNANMYHDRFEQAFCDYLGVKYAVCLPSCTSAIHLALASADIGPGDEVIVPDITWIATSAPISDVGATPVFADIDIDTWCISAESFESCITSRTRAVIPVDLYGGMSDMDAIRVIAKKHGIMVVEDAAEAIGAEYKGQKAGSLGDVGVFSFHGSKTLTTGEGGMLVTDRKDIFDRVLFLRDHGRAKEDKMFWNTEIAYKYKMSSMQAALGLAQLERIDELVALKRRIFEWYERELLGVSGLTLNYTENCSVNGYWMVTIILDECYGLDKNSLISLMAKRNIDCRPFFYPLSQLPAYSSEPQAKLASERNCVSYRIAPYGVNLPSAMNLTESDVKRVCRCMISILER